MRDISELETRIKNLEYYTSLTLLENEIFNTPIASGVTPTLNRFKNGYIVDDFDNTLSAEIGHPEFFCEM
jgi:hypothetical protein